MSAVLHAVDLYRFFHAGDDETLALRGVSIHLEPGEVVAVSGPSGSGKSTLLACLAGLDDPDGGTVYVCGELMSRRPEWQRAALRSRAVGVLFQHGNLLDHLSVEQNIAFAQRLAGRVDRQRVRELVAEVGLTARASLPPTVLSGGESARAGLAVALANQPAVILADEPTGEVDEATAQRIMSLLVRHASTGAAVMIVTHDERVAATADRVVHLFDGRVAE